jgi:hypothetical protein
MAEQKKKEEVFTSPKGVAKFPHLTKPQTMVGDKPCDPNYSVKLLLDPNDAATVALVEKIKETHAKGYAEVKAQAAADAKKNGKKAKVYNDMGTQNMIEEDTNKEGEPTGLLAIKFKAKAEGKRRDGSVWAFKPALFDVRGAALPADAPIYGGSVIKVAFSIRHAAMDTGAFYTSLNLKAVQGLVIKSSYERNASDFGFASEETQDAFGEEATGEASGAEATADF